MNTELAQAPDEERPLVEQPSPARPLNRPVRWLVAAAEVAAAVVLVVLAAWAWRRASVPIELPASDNPAIPRFTTRTSGPWVAAAVTLVTAAGALVLDAVRQAILAARASHRARAEQAEHADDAENQARDAGQHADEPGHPEPGQAPSAAAESGDDVTLRQ